MKNSEDIEFYDRIKDECSFMEFSKDTVRSLLMKDLPLGSGMNLIKSKLPKIDSPFDNKDYIPMVDISGSESIVFFKTGDDNFIYKLNRPSFRILDSRFNTYIWSFLLQDYLFPKFRYHSFKFSPKDNCIFMKQRLSLGDVTTFNAIKLRMENNGWNYEKSVNGFFAIIEEQGVIVHDLNPSNAKVNGMDVEGFDPRFRLIYKNYL